VAFHKRHVIQDFEFLAAVHVPAPMVPVCLQFLGLKSKQERENERQEEQKVIEARIREREVGL
jgi:hypothetical protein